MKPLIVVSHSLSFTVKCRQRQQRRWSLNDDNIDIDEEYDDAERENAPSGLGTALSRLIARVDDAVWVACPGGHFKPDMKLPESTSCRRSSGIITTRHSSDSSVPLNHHHTCSHLVWDDIKSARIQPVFIDDKVHQRYLNAMCANSLWPLLHSMSTYAHFSLENWLAYMQANTEFARVTLDLITERRRKYSDGSTIIVWIHDYHLIMMPLVLRRMLQRDKSAVSSVSSSPTDSEDQSSEEFNTTTTTSTTTSSSTRIAFSLHTPFPPWDIFRLAPWSRDLLTGLLASHLICFVSPSYAANFLECCSRVLGARVNRHDMLVEYEGHTSVVKCMPVGFDYEWYEQAKAKLSCPNLSNQEKIILSIDRLDYTKGLIERVLGYERLLEKYTELRSQTVLHQIVTPPGDSSTLDAQRSVLKHRLDREIARVCGRFGTANWVPIRYIYQTVTERELVRTYARACVGLVNGTSQQWAKEFIACAHTRAVLVMSVFGSGSAETSAHAVLVNPLEKDMLADALKAALDMDTDEKCSRMISLKASLKRYDLKAWASAVCDAAMQTPPNCLNQVATKLPPPAILISFVERRQKQQKNVKSTIERHEPSIALKNIV